MKKILLLDDSTDYGIILTLQLKPHQYEVDHQETVEDAIQSLRVGSDFDYVFCDFYIGAQSAYDFVKSFKEIFANKPAPRLVVLTNLPTDSPQLAALRSEGFQVYQKPTRSEQIVELVQSLDPSPHILPDNAQETPIDVDQRGQRQ